MKVLSLTFLLALCLFILLFIWQLNFLELDRQHMAFCALPLPGRHSKH